MLRRCLLILLCLFILAMPVFAEHEISHMQSGTAVSSTGTCQVNLSVTIHLDSAVDDLEFPLPAAAKNISVNGSRVSARRDGPFRYVNLSRYLGKAGGDTMLTFSYTLPNAVAADENGALFLTLPLLSGFAYPVSKMEFSVTLPGELIARPTFTSGYLKESIESHLSYTFSGATVSGTTINQLEDHETLTMTLEVPQELFPGIRKVVTTTRFSDILAAVCAGLALLYWLIFLRCLPTWPIRWPNPPEGISAGELGCRLTGTGPDLTMMVITWAQLGYIMIQMDNSGRVLLHKRMEMGNERSELENRCFRGLFGKKKMVDGSGYRYAILCRKVAAMPQKTNGQFRRYSGNPRVFRVLAAGTNLFLGISIAVTWATSLGFQIVLSILLGVFALVSSWLVNRACQQMHLHDRQSRRIGLICGGIWLLVGLMSGMLLFGVLALVNQYVSGLAAAYGGRRNELGRQTVQSILGLRRYLNHVSKADLKRIAQGNPYYFYEMAPYAFALGVGQNFARHYGTEFLPDCSYLITDRPMQLRPGEWMQLLHDTVEALDERQKQLPWERFLGK